MEHMQRGTQQKKEKAVFHNQKGEQAVGEKHAIVLTICCSRK